MSAPVSGLRGAHAAMLRASAARDEARCPARGCHPRLWLARLLPCQGDPAARDQHLAQLAALSADALEPYARFYHRVGALLQDRGARLLEWAAASRIAVGLGDESVLEIGLRLHHTYGVPMIPGSAQKGLCVRYARAVLALTADEMRAVFGAGGDDGAAGAVRFHDALWKPVARPFQRDVITVHHRRYYQADPAAALPPAEWDSPEPHPYVTATGEFRFALEGDPRAVALAERALGMALEDWGIGARTAKGYGRFRVAAAREHRARTTEALAQAAAAAPAQLFQAAERCGRGAIEFHAGRDAFVISGLAAGAEVKATQRGLFDTDESARDARTRARGRKRAAHIWYVQTGNAITVRRIALIDEAAAGSPTPPPPAPAAPGAPTPPPAAAPRAQGVPPREPFGGALAGLAGRIAAPGEEWAVVVDVEPWLFGGGAVPREVDEAQVVRGPSILGQLRLWFRLLSSAGTAAELREEEAQVFGAASRPAPFRIAVAVLDPGRDEDPPKAGSPLGYLAFSARGQDDPVVPAAQLRAGVRVRISLRGALPPTLLRAAEVWLALGGIGSRTRRGLGAVQIAEVSERAATWDERLQRLLGSAPREPRGGGQIRSIAGVWRGRDEHSSARDCLTSLAQSYQRYRQDRDDGGRRGPGRSKWEEPALIRARLGLGAPRRAAAVGAARAPGWARATLGLPIVFKLHDAHEAPVLCGRTAERLASPVWFRPVRLGPDRYVAALVILTAPYAPPGGLQLRWSAGPADVEAPRAPEQMLRGLIDHLLEPSRRVQIW